MSFARTEGYPRVDLGAEYDPRQGLYRVEMQYGTTATKVANQAGIVVYTISVYFLITLASLCTTQPFTLNRTF